MFRAFLIAPDDFGGEVRARAVKLEVVNPWQEEEQAREQVVG